MNDKKNFYLTTTLPYVNAPLHIGHALEFVRADTIARYKKLLGYNVFFNTGTDEHGVKIYDKAMENNLSPQDFVDNGFKVFKEQLKMFGVLEDLHFIRTTDEHHIKAAQEFWKRVHDNGFIELRDYSSKYCAGCESEKTDSDLVNGECPEHLGIALKLIEEKNYFFKYSVFTDKLLKFYEANPTFVIPDFRFNEIKNFIKNGLQDFSISRLKEKMPWGIPVPGDDSQVMYVWFDALTNYISTLGWPEDSENFEDFWKNGNPTQYCGKDNNRFQSAMWQAMLMAADLPNSHQIVINGHITGEGGIRMSKTLGNVVDPRDISNKYGVDALRYFLLKEVSSFEDSPFTIQRFHEAYNSGLVNGLGNLTSRILTMSSNYGVNLSEDDLKIKYYTDKIPELEEFDIYKHVNNVWINISDLNKFIQDKEPFKKIKINEEEAKKDVKYLLVHLYGIALSLEPMIPDTSIKIQNLIKENKKPEAPLFPRIEE
ncbi:MAG: methionine--tRNA ligase [Candidatus Pacebacteria bacterium]|nr:methionine--tRNA ligase [Candidatus Paceibacterota bacterium]